ncbi:PH domain-containing protein [Allosaccharopolyspora coralli]|uniref:PH domain-containing protein n=1 Tax=Allosaccharopolyspora coralli TaxID=2665642 RepID=A0A5Q3QDS0_9PSEU|nr:PH domain-containing protein [Allosaccharopolyspora coralli]
MLPEGEGWTRLDPKSVVAVSSLVALLAIPPLAIMALSGAERMAVLVTAGGWLLIVLGVCITSWVSWHFTRYRITGHRFELRAGRLSRSHKSIPRDRIRSVDLTANPVHRVFGLSVVKIGTGQQAGDSEIKLDAVTTPRAEALRHELLRTPSTADTAAESHTASVPAAETLSSIRPAWFGYGALTVSLAAVVWGAIASAIGSFADVIMNLGLDDAVLGDVVSLPVWISVTAGVLGALLVGALGAVLLSLEMWWGFTLTREQDSMLRVRRGLLTVRSLSLEERRLRGVELVEPMLLRWVGGARLNAVATGLSDQQSGNRQPDRAALMPPAPREEVRRVSGVALGTDPPVPSRTLVRHPFAALRRRLFRATAVGVLVGTALVLAATVTGWLIPLAWALAIAALLIAWAFGLESYWNLGHELLARHLLARSGVGVRRTVALERDGIIGWRVEQTIFQRPAGLVTISATTAAGSGAYAVRDVAATDGLTVAEEAVPNLLTPFLERDG